MKAPVGAQVRLFYDGELLRRGDALRTATGRLYAVLSVRVQQRGRYVGRQHLSCVVVRKAPKGARVLPLFWYPRERKSA